MGMYLMKAGNNDTLCISRQKKKENKSINQKNVTDWVKKKYMI